MPMIHGEDIPEEAHFVRLPFLRPKTPHYMAYMAFLERVLYGPRVIPLERFVEHGGFQNNTAYNC